MQQLKQLTLLSLLSPYLGLYNIHDVNHWAFIHTGSSKMVVMGLSCVTRTAKDLRMNIRSQWEGECDHSSSRFYAVDGLLRE